MIPEDIPGRVIRLESEVEHAVKRLEDVELDVDTATALANLPQRVDDLREAVGDIRSALDDLRTLCKRRFDAMTLEGSDGKVIAAPSKLDLKTWLTIVATIAVPIVAAIVATKG